MILRKPKILQILRGPSGSGKTTWAREQTNAYRCASDDYFLEVDPNGKIIYNFDVLKKSEAHRWNEERVTAAMQIGIPNIIIDNTCIEFWEMRFYVNQALKQGYKIKIKRFGEELKLNELEQRVISSEHHTPTEIIDKMMTNFQEYTTLNDISIAKKPKELEELDKLKIKMKKYSKN